MNYFLFHATTSAYVMATGLPAVHSATVIGAPCLSAILIAVFHCFLLSGESTSYNFSTILFRRLFLLSAFMGIVGNVIHAHGVNSGSVEYAVLGRFLLGFSSAEILHRQLLRTCLPSHIVSEAALLVRSRVGGIVCGLLVGSLAETIPIRIERLGARAFQTTSWLMAILWAVHFLQILFRFTPRVTTNRSKTVDSSGQLNDNASAYAPAPETDYDSSESSESDVNDTSNSVFYRTSSSKASRDSLQATYGTSGATISLPSQGNANAESSLLRKSSSAVERRRGFGQQVKTFTSRIRKLMAYHIGIPVALGLICYVNFALEVLFTASPIITWQYFEWSGARAGLVLGCLACFILPVDFICEQVSRRYEERTVMKVRMIAPLVYYLSFFTLFSQRNVLFFTALNVLYRPRSSCYH